MIVVFRRFRARTGDEAIALDALRKYATTLIRHRRADAVMVCQRADVPESLLWMQHHSGRLVPPPGADESLARGVESDGIAIRAQFVDGSYRFPLPPCRVWAAETSDEAAARELFAISRGAPCDPHICGVSIYRTMEQVSRIIAFFAVVPDASTERYLAARAHAFERSGGSFQPLRASWTVGRLMPGAPYVGPTVQYPQSFSARVGLVLPSNAAEPGEPVVMATTYQRRS